MITRQFTCFGNGDTGGNPALVIEDGPASEAERTALARERALTCVFIDPPGAAGVATLDFIYPHMRSPLCLHATLAAPGLSLASTPGVASVGSPKLLLEVADAATLHGLQPDLALIHDWGKSQGISGCYVWCRLGEHEVEGRNFNHLDPLLEDRATGVAAGALTALLGHGLLLRQGRNSGNDSGSDCLIRTALDGDAVLVGGRVRAEPARAV